MICCREALPARLNRCPSTKRRASYNSSRRNLRVLLHCEPETATPLRRNLRTPQSTIESEHIRTAQVTTNDASTPVSFIGRAVKFPAIPDHQYANRPVSISAWPIMPGRSDCEYQAISPSSTPAPNTIGTIPAVAQLLVRCTSVKKKSE